MKHKQSIFTVLLVTFTAVIFVLNVYPFIKHNGAGGGYGGGGDDGSTGIQSIDYQSIEYYIQAAGTYYLEANSHLQTLLKLVEQQEIHGVNYFEMQFVVNRALYNMQMAKQTYEQLIRKAEATPYNENFLAQLREFDYDSFMQKNSLNPVLFDLVRQYLQNGDITGMFKRTYADVTVMIDLLVNIRDSVYQYGLPGISLFRQLNEKQALTSVFGSYTARVFSEIHR
jgi:hypothetical protein